MRPFLIVTDGSVSEKSVGSNIESKARPDHNGR